MQREIKFRAVNSVGSFIYGLPYTDGTNDTLYFNKYSNRLCWRNEKGAHCNQPYKNGTLMEYTGLKDKNGKEIYEGDICTYIGKYRSETEVCFENGCFVGRSQFNTHPLIEYISADDFESIEVTGNKYESQEAAQEEAV